MSHQIIDVRATSTAAPEQVWTLLSDPNTWSDWGPWHESGTVPADSPDRGIGLRQRFRTRGVTSIEEITEFTPPHRLGYKLISGLPLRSYSAVVTLEPREDGGTEIQWLSIWKGTISGLLFRRTLETFIADAARRLAIAAASLNSSMP